MSIPKQINKTLFHLKIIGLSCLLTTSILAAEASDVNNYEEIKNRLCYDDCQGMEPEEWLKEGVLAMEALIDSGFDVPIEGEYRLASSYHQLRFKYKSGSENRKLYRKKSIEKRYSAGSRALKEVDALENLNAQQIEFYTKILFGSIGSFDLDEQVKILNKILSFNPNNIEVRFLYGQFLTMAGKTKEGQAQMEQAFATAQYSDATYQAKILIEEFNERGEYAEARRIFALLEGKPSEFSDISDFKEAWLYTADQEVTNDAKIKKAKQKLEAAEQEKIPAVENTQPVTPVVKTEPVSQETPPMAEETPAVDQKISDNQKYIGIGLGVLALLFLVGLYLRTRRK